MITFYCGVHACECKIEDESSTKYGEQVNGSLSIAFYVTYHNASSVYWNMFMA